MKVVEEIVKRTYADNGNWLPPSEAQPLVRCQDCKYHFVDGDNVRFNMCLLNHNKVQPDNWFCADGERSDGDE